MTETLTVHRPGAETGTRDGQGNPIRSADSTFTVNAIAVAPETANESVDDNIRFSTNGYTIYLPYGTDLRTTDLIDVRGTSGWQVQGDAGAVDWVSPFSSWMPGTVAIVRKAS